MSNNTNNKPHPHAELIKAWADGAKIQLKVRDAEKWIDTDSPVWNKCHEYRIKPEENEPWKPKEGEEYHYFSDDGVVDWTLWNNTITDGGRYEIGNCFHSQSDAEAAALRIKAALKGDTTDDMKVWLTENDIEGGLQLTIGELKKWYRKLNKENEMVLKLDVPYLDGKQLSEGEKALIRAIRNLGIHEVFKDDGLLVFKDENNNLETDGDVVAFSSMGQNSTIREVLNKIKKEQGL